MMPTMNNAMTGQWNQILCGLVNRLIRTRISVMVRAAAMGRGQIREALLGGNASTRAGGVRCEAGAVACLRGWRGAAPGRVGLSPTGEAAARTVPVDHGDSIADHGSDVLHLLLTETVESDGELVADLIVNRAGNHDAAGLGKFLQPRRDVDPVAIDVVAVDHDVSQIDADAKPHSCVSGRVRLLLEISCWISIAHCTASTTLANSAITASPQVLTIRPSWRSTKRVIAVRWRCSSASVPASSASMRREYPCTSAHRTVVNRRFTLSVIARYLPEAGRRL